MRAPDLRPFLEEDVGDGDVTSQVFLPPGNGKAIITCESDSVVAGWRRPPGSSTSWE
ncbi:hypothetical protein [Candidatus Methanomethylophilus sp. 1R26]|uniref:hypothetical protein n=1 Tax=Candidatus Methanomethylophilus sp. 1R26 TaxID=1769296 RepID=UPI0019100B72|nr:hypothetical protein [Candidatus Methanomethylophilus sp. 1R26]